MEVLKNGESHETEFEWMGTQSELETEFVASLG